MSLFEVHFWPGTGRILLIHIPAGVSAEPILTDIRIQDVPANEYADSTTPIIANELAKSSNPIGEVFEHTADGQTFRVDVDSFARAQVYGPATAWRTSPFSATDSERV